MPQNRTVPTDSRRIAGPPVFTGGFPHFFLVNTARRRGWCSRRTFHPKEDQAMSHPLRRRITTWALVLALAWALILPTPARAITFGEEEELSAEMLRIIFKKLPVAEDSYVTDYVNRVGKRILAVMPEQPFRYRFYVINQDMYNAFATPAGHIFVYSGLIEAMDGEDELAGILGHEIAHVYCRHISQKIELAKKMSWAQLAGMAAGVLLGVAGGSGAAASAVTMGSLASGVSAQLAFSRENETQADQLGLKFLSDAGYGTEGLLRVLKKIRSKQWFSKEQVPTYMLTHPAIEDRIAYVTSWIEDHPADAQPKFKPNPVDFERIGTRLIAEYSDPTSELALLEQTLQRDPGNTLARYRYGLVLARANRSAEAITQLKEVLARNAFNPYMLRDLGKVYFLAGRLDQALSTLESARSMIPADPDTLFFLGRTLQEMGQRTEAIALYTAIIQKTPDYREAYYFMGQNLGQQGSLADAHYYLGLYHFRGRDFKTAIAQFKQALRNSPDPETRERVERLLKQAEDEIKAEKKALEG
jgi:predicted Zn-dependent protease